MYFLQELLEISKKLNNSPDISEITMEKINILKDNVSFANKKVKRILNSYPWVWFICYSDKERKDLFLDFLQSFSK